MAALRPEALQIVNDVSENLLAEFAQISNLVFRL